MLEHIIFAIDHDTNTHVVSRFLKYVSQEQALQRFGKLTHLVGCYNGHLECSYMVTAKNWDKIKQFAANQDSILRVPGDTRQPCVLEFLATGNRVSIGQMREVEPLDALGQMAWSFNLDTGKYYVCK